DGEMLDVSEDIALDKNKKHSIEVVIDRIVVKEGIASRLADSLESALKLGGGRVLIDVMGEEELLFSEHHACPHCGFSIGELEPRMFSFNSPFGACPSC
ncbi:excinuclease ABC subunit UvrA, partial [Bacillus sp. D-CC]